MTDVPQVISVSAMWPSARICLDEPPSASTQYTERTLLPLTPVCTRAMFLSYGTSSVQFLFRYDGNALSQRRDLLDKMISTVVSHLGLQAYMVGLFGSAVFHRTMQVFDYGWHSDQLRIPAILDVALSTAFAEKGTGFTITRDKGETVASFYRKIPNTDTAWFERYLRASVFSVDPIAGNTTSNLCFDVMEWIRGIFSGQTVTHTNYVSNDYVINIQFSFDKDIQRLLFVYLSTLSGPLCDKVSRIQASKNPDTNSVLLQINTERKQSLEIWDQMLQLAVDLVPLNTPKISYSRPDETSDIQFTDPSPATKRALARRPKWGGQGPHVVTQEEEPEEVEILPGLYDYAESIDQTGWQNASYLTNGDLKMLGLVSTSKQEAKRKLRRMFAKLDRAIEWQLQEESSLEEADIHSENEEMTLDTSPSEMLIKYSKLTLQTQIAIDLIRNDLSKLQIQCANCTLLRDNQQKLVMYNLFFKIKEVIAIALPSTSTIFDELAVEDSRLNKRLRRTGIQNIVPIMRRIMALVSSDRLELAHPNYRGEELFWSHSRELRSLFVSLLPHYQPGCPKVPDAFNLIDRTPAEIPETVSLEDVKRMKELHDVLVNQLESLVEDFKTGRLESKACVAAYRDHENLLVGHVFKSCLEELRKLAGSMDLSAAALKLDHPVHVRMLQLGISDGTQLRKMASFVTKYRNEAAHPRVEKFDMSALNWNIPNAKDLKIIVSDFLILRDKLPMFKRIFQGH